MSFRSSKKSKQKRRRSTFYDEPPEKIFEEEEEQQPTKCHDMGRSKFYTGDENETTVEDDEESETRKKGKDDRPQVVEQKLNFPPTVLWAETSEVLTSGILENMTTYDVTLQEVKFEVITSELRYLNSINVLLNQFYESEELSSTCSKDDWRYLFGNVTEVKVASEQFLSDLLSQWKKDLMLSGMYPIIRKHSATNLRVLIEFCRNQPRALYTLQHLMTRNGSFKRVLQVLEHENNPLMSYLAVPMQRVCRLPLLLQAVQDRLDQSTVEHSLCKLAKTSIKKLAAECNASVVIPT